MYLDPMVRTLTDEQKDHIRAVIASATTPEEVDFIEEQLKVTALATNPSGRGVLSPPGADVAVRKTPTLQTRCWSNGLQYLQSPA